MADIVLIDSDERLSSELSDFLRRRQHTVTICRGASEVTEELRTNRAVHDVIALNMSRNRPEDWDVLQQIHEFIGGENAGPRILCFSTAYWGPRMQIAIERRGGRLVYLQ